MSKKVEKITGGSVTRRGSRAKRGVVAIFLIMGFLVIDKVHLHLIHHFLGGAGTPVGWVLLVLAVGWWVSRFFRER